MADYNLLIDKLNTDAERIEVEQEATEVRGQNDIISREVDLLFSEKQEKEATIQQLEREIEQERNMADNLVSAMQPELREKYLQLKDQNLQYQVRQLFSIRDINWSKLITIFTHVVRPSLLFKIAQNKWE